MEDSSHTGHAIRQLQNMVLKVAAGAAADTNITVAGVKVGDGIKVLAFTAGVPSEVAGTVTITAANTVQVSVDTTGDNLVFFHFPKSN